MTSWYPRAVFKGTAEEMLEWIDLVNKGFIDKDHAVLRVATQRRAGDFGDRFPYLFFEEDRLLKKKGQTGAKMLYGREMSKSIQSHSNYGGKPQEGTDIIACVGEKDNMVKRINQARRFAAVPWINQVRVIVFWAEKWDESLWKKYEHFFQSLVVILKWVGEDPIHVRSGKPLEFRHDRLYPLFNATAQHDGYEVL